MNFISLPAIPPSPKLACLNSKRLPFPGNLASATFGQIIYNVLNRGKSARPPLFNGLQVLPSASDKANLLAETPSGTPIMMTQVSFTCFLPFWQTFTLIKQKSLSPPINLALATFGKLLILFLAEVNLQFILYLMVLRLSSASDKTNWLAKTSPRTVILMNQVSFTCCLFFCQACLC